MLTGSDPIGAHEIGDCKVRQRDGSELQSCSRRMLLERLLDHKCGIRQGFAVATPSLTPRLLFFPLWMLFATNAGRENIGFYIGGAYRPPAGRPAPCRPLAGR